MTLFKNTQLLKKANLTSGNGSSISDISAYLLSKEPNAKFNLFRLLGHKWVTDPEIINRASLMFEKLSPEYKFLFNAIFWNEERFHKFCVTPSSLNGHHSFLHGNLLHTIEVFESIFELQKASKFANKEIGLALAILHDAGKADEYELTSYGKWVMSKRGSLIGHKVTIFEWVVVAVNEHKIQLKEDHYECLLHGLSAVANAPDWMGLRHPSTHESLLLSHADRISGTNSLLEQTCEESGFGSYHKHLNTRIFKIGDV